MISRTILFLSIILLHFTSNLKAQSTPPSGGELTYEYIGARTGIPYHYLVTLVIYKTVDTTAYVSQEAIISSSCFPNQVLNLKPFVPQGAPVSGHGGVALLSSKNCGDTLNSDSLQLFSYHYMDTVLLPGRCTDFEIGYTQCCRSPHISNIVQPDSSKLYLGALLNNMFGPNTSPRFIESPRYLFCKSQGVQLTMWAIEPDGDSLNYTSAPILDSNGRAVSYAPGLNVTNPFPTASGYTVTSFIPTTGGLYSTVLQIEEYRYIPIIGIYVKVGSVTQEINIVVRDTCPSYLYASYNGGLIKKDTIYGVGCNDTVISFGTNTFSENGISIHGSEFRIIGPDSVARPVEKASTNSNPALISDSIWLELHRAPLKNGVYFLYLKNGNFYSGCGNLYPNDILYFVVSDCNTTSTQEEPNKSISIYPNPTHSSFTIQTGEHLPERITLFDMQGREIKKIQPNSSTSEIDISEFSSGIYLLKVDVGEYQIMKRVEKM